MSNGHNRKKSAIKVFCLISHTCRCLCLFQFTRNNLAYGSFLNSTLNIHLHLLLSVYSFFFFSFFFVFSYFFVRFLFCIYFFNCNMIVLNANFIFLYFFFFNFTSDQIRVPIWILNDNWHTFSGFSTMIFCF